MQGWAKRWFVLDRGVLSYAKDPQSYTRGSITIATASISVVPQRLLINVDSGSDVFQLRALTKDDYDAWMEVIRTYKSVNDFTESMTNLLNDEASDSLHELRIATMKRGAQKQAESRESMDNFAEANSSIETELEGMTQSLEKLKRAALGGDVRPSMDEGRKWPDRKSMLSKMSPRKPTFDENLAPNHTPSTAHLHELVQRLHASIDNVRKEHFRQQVVFKSTAARRDQLEQENQALILENVELLKQLGQQAPSSPSSEASAKASTMALRRLHQRTDSIMSSLSVEFFDAHDDIIVNDDLSSIDSAGEEEFFKESSKSMGGSSARESDEERERTMIQAMAQEQAAQLSMIERVVDNQRIHFERRTILPSPVVVEPISLVSILKKNVGKDLSTIAMPVSMNEPINLLQKLCEELEYSELLDKAAQCSDPADRLMFLAAFSVSPYASTQYRALRKPFNPLHGETYESVRPDRGFKFLAEKVSHNPPIMACHAESPNYVFWQDSRLRSKFWGKSMELNSLGTVHIILPTHNHEHYTYQKPTSWMRNLIAGSKYLEHAGQVKIFNHSTGHYCVINYKESGMFSSSRNEVAATVHAPDGRVVRRLSGRWSEALVHEQSQDQQQVVWRAHPPIPNHHQYFGFTQFAMELNEVTPDIEGMLPITDTRLRPDQRLYEMGNVEEADVEKQRLEERQRAYRRTLEEQGIEWEPQWFHLTNDPITGEVAWQYQGGYWQSRENRNFPNRLQLW